MWWCSLIITEVKLFKWKNVCCKLISLMYALNGKRTFKGEAYGQESYCNGSGTSSLATGPEESEAVFCLISALLQLDTWQDACR